MAGTRIGAVLSQLSSGPVSVLAWVCIAVLLIAVGDAFFSYASDVLLAQVGQRVVGRIRHELFAHLQTLAPGDLEKHHSGSLLARLTGDIQMLRQMLVDALVSGAQNVLLIGAMIGVMFWLNPTLALLGVVTIPLTLWATWHVSRQIRKAVTRQREQESVVTSIAQDVLGAIPVIQAFSRESFEQQRFARQNRSSIRAGVKATRLESKLYRIVSLASAAGTCAILYVGVRSVLSGVMTAGDLLVFVSYLRSVNKPMRKVAKLAGQVAKAAACGERVAEVFAMTPSIKDRPGATPLVAARGQIRFDAVDFEYQPGVAVLSDIRLSIEPGERLALVGHTGAGKTTLVKLLLRFYDPKNGGVCVDGVNLRDLTLRSLRQAIGWVHQDTILFGMTVGENIALGRPDAPPELIQAAARCVHADAFIDALPKGYDTVLGEGGHSLSGGQRQRIALARALLREPRILLLDEPATGLDHQTRRLVEQAWMSSTNKSTTLVICHRLHDMHRFDRVVVMSKGRIVECGSHEDLLAADREYAALVRAGGDDRFRIARAEEVA